MKKLLTLIILLFVFTSTKAQNDTARKVVAVDDSTIVQIEATFPGGLAGWRKYLEKNLKTRLANRCITIPKGKHEANQTVIVSFTVDVDGTISNVVAVNAASVCPLLAAEAVRVIQKGPRWVPAQQNGKNVKYHQRQSITWVLSE